MREDGSTPDGDFGTTRWSLVLAAADRSSPTSMAALTKLCEAYWYPLYAYARRHAGGHQDAADLTQEFFARLLDKNYLAAAQPARGKFRAYLLTAFRHFMANEWDKLKAHKRGGGARIVSLDFNGADKRFLAEPGHELTPERLYERQWALTLLADVLSRLKQEYKQDGKLDLFEQLKGFLGGSPGEKAYSSLARALGISEGAARVAAHRLRRRYQKLLRDAIAETVASPAEVDEEIESLFAALAS